MTLSSTKPKFFVFVLMPFSSEFDDVYELGIKPACEKTGAYAERVDEQIFNSNILEHIYNQIAKADLIVADMSGRNPNVFYECGYAHALGKRVVLLTKNSKDIPFDLKHYLHIIYGESISTLKKELAKRVKWHIENPDIPPLDKKLINIFVGEVQLNGISCPKISPEFLSNGIEFTINFSNPTKNYPRTVQFRFAIISPIKMDVMIDNGYFPQHFENNKEFVYCYDKDFELMQGEYDSLAIQCGFNIQEYKNLPGRFISRIMTKEGVLDFPFMI